MNIDEVIFICIIVVVFVAFISWGLTASYYENKRQRTCHHDFEKVIEVDKPGVHKVAYLCKECGLVKKVEL